MKSFKDQHEMFLTFFNHSILSNQKLWNQELHAYDEVQSFNPNKLIFQLFWESYSAVFSCFLQIDPHLLRLHCIAAKETHLTLPRKRKMNVDAKVAMINELVVNKAGGSKPISQNCKETEMWRQKSFKGLRVKK